MATVCTTRAIPHAYEDQPGASEGDGPATGSACGSIDDTQNPMPEPPGSTPGSRALTAEEQAYQDCLSGLDVRQEGWRDINQRWLTDQSFFTAAAALHSVTRGVPPDPDGNTYWAYPANRGISRRQGSGT